MRVGIGYDIHRLIPTVTASQVPIGGHLIDCPFKIDSHSDGDVLLHALADACLGSLALGDIGQWFPNTDPKNRNRPSTDFVRIIKAEVERCGWEVCQIDSIVNLESPKLSPHIDTIRRNLAGCFNLELSDVSVKAKSGEGLGPVGTRKAISSQVVVMLKKKE